MQRPTALTVFGILNIVFAVLGLLGVVASVMLFFAVENVSSNPVVQIIHNNPTYAGWMKISIGLGLPAAGALLAAGIGLLQIKPWARILSIVYAIYAVVMLMISTVINYFCLLQPMLQAAQEKQGPEAAAAIGGAIGGTFGSCFGLIYPVVLLIFMTRPKLVAVFQPGPPAPGQS